MTGKNKTPLIGWHSADPTLKPWIQARARQCGLTVREFLDRVLAAHRAEHDPVVNRAGRQTQDEPRTDITEESER